MLEQAEYPYIEGSHGIPFFKMAKGSAYIETAQGRMLNYTLEPDTVYVWDPDLNVANSLMANVNEGVLTLSLHPTPDDMHETPRHPDLFAGKFIDFVLGHFNKNHVAIESHLSDWHSGRNLQEFGDLWVQGADLGYAANQTWIGKKIISKGFSPATDSDVAMKKGSVYAVFKKDTEFATIER